MRGLHGRGEVAPTWWRSIDDCIICMQYEMAMVAHVSLSGTSSPVVGQLEKQGAGNGTGTGTGAGAGAGPERYRITSLIIRAIKWV